MDVQIVDHNVPASCRPIGGNHGLDVGQKVSFRPRRPTGWREDLPAHHVPAEDKRADAVLDVRKLMSFDLPWRQGQAGMLPLQRLHARQFTGADDPFALLATVGASRYRVQMSATLVSNCSSSTSIS
jgi:hypothetical protein